MKNKIAQNEKKVKKDLIIEKIRQGYSRKRLIEWVMENFNHTYKYSWDLTAEAYQTLADINNQELIEKTRAIQLERVEAILQDALEKGDRKNALKAADLINKMYSLYVEKKEIGINASDLSFRLE